MAVLTSFIQHRLTYRHFTDIYQLRGKMAKIILCFWVCPFAPQIVQKVTNLFGGVMAQKDEASVRKTPW